jgi:uncharacterized protein with HEPN domain
VPSRNLQQRLQDILEISTEIEIFTAGMSFAEFAKDTKTVKAVLYNLAIIGEAVSQLLPEIEFLYPEIPWIDIRAIRNVIIHEYFRVDLSIIWETIQTDLPPLVRQLRELIECLNQER